ncbi:MAG: RecX family transcriptional regulator [Hydrotalea flava]|nr:RecX family transcriptional regulator [Hydrotalea flava]NIM37484.1 RecX family transcriptional regulator [Hydrotalea flava]NIN02652.1 RecX family transcriptional regulator [Hydrotalea flava]NIN14327.1 RecX family transcriptional regulator [Hydrotalea flava]NIO93410.1 RecX family transcriptional regulator [Hydrotalea flava]
MNSMQQKLTPEQALQKVKHYCAYRERSHDEVKQKLYGLGLYTTDIEKIMTGLIEENYLNESRFAILFAGGHFRQKKWGRKKIEFELKQKKVSAYNIKKALASIDETQYRQTLQELVSKKWQSLQGDHYFAKMAKTRVYLQQKGYEPALIAQQIQLLKEQTKTA